MDIKVKINSFAVPDKVNLQGKLRSRQDGFHESLSLNLSELDEIHHQTYVTNLEKMFLKKQTKKILENLTILVLSMYKYYQMVMMEWKVGLIYFLMMK